METRRTFLGSAVATTAALALAPDALARPRPRRARPRPELVARIGGAAVARPEILMWEARRLAVVAERMRTQLPNLGRELDALFVRRQASISEVPHDRRALVDAKVAAGHAAMRRVVGGDLLLSGPAAALAAQQRRFAISTIELRSSRGTAQGFVDWFTAAAADERAMLVACPDHYVLDQPRPGVQHVVEVTGGAFLASEFSIDYGDGPPAQIPDVPGHPIRIGGPGRNPDGVTIGLVKHQFGDRPRGGFTANLSIGFPQLLPSWYVSEHRWHLACEFSNWVEAYLADTSPRQT